MIKIGDITTDSVFHLFLETSYWYRYLLVAICNGLICHICVLLSGFLVKVSFPDLVLILVYFDLTVNCNLSFSLLIQREQSEK